MFKLLEECLVEKLKLDAWIMNQKLLTGLQIILQNLSDMMSGKNKIQSDIYENLLDINFYKCF